MSSSLKSAAIGCILPLFRAVAMSSGKRLASAVLEGARSIAGSWQEAHLSLNKAARRERSRSKQRRSRSENAYSPARSFLSAVPAAGAPYSVGMDFSALAAEGQMPQLKTELSSRFPLEP